VPEVIRLRANAKVNLFLRVVGRADNGWHELETIFHGIALADGLDIAHAAPGVIEVDMTTSSAPRDDLPAPEDNLVSIAAAGVARLARRPVGTSIAVTKNIPIGAGLAGGSADAAATIVGLDALWELGLTAETIVGLATALGSDVPFCLRGGTALGTGRGNDLIVLQQAASMWFVLGLSDRPLLTAEVYEAWDGVGSSSAVSSGVMVDALVRGDPSEVARHLHNDLLAPAVSLRPEIEGGVAALVDGGALGAGMSGSGPTVFGVAAGPDEARELARKVDGAFARVEVVSSALTGVEWM
jgi:4-diphosphocytidyl-2-C-methyl-D-erythritol kinase